jgi:glycine/sarcosine N-methyltransferase
LRAGINDQGCSGVGLMFQDFADVYDAMIDWPKRLAYEGPFYRRLFEQYAVKSVLDAACGAGKHAAMFHDWGLSVEGADLSPRMIDLARAAFGELPDLRWAVRGFEQSLAIPESFDAVVCVGNSLPLAPDMEIVRLALKQMLAVLRKGGVLVVHALNVWRLPDGPCIWQKCRRAALACGEVLIVKGVHRCGSRGLVELIVATMSDQPTMQTDSVPFLGLDAAELQSMAEACGAAHVRLLGGYKGESYSRHESFDILLVAEKA